MPDFRAKREKPWTSSRKNIEERNKENYESLIIDKIIEWLRRQGNYLHADELAVLARRERVIYASKINDAFERIHSSNYQRYFSFFNPVTDCLNVFYFQFGGNREGFREQLDKLTHLRLGKAIKDIKFKFSAFGYGFRKSKLSLYEKAQFDECMICIEDASECVLLSDSEYQSALGYFGDSRQVEIREFKS